MKVLTPFEAYFLANSVYNLTSHSADVLKRLYKSKTHHQFPGVAAPLNPATLHAFSGHSGIRFVPAAFKYLTATTGFGFLAQQQGANSREFVLVTRGTDILPDWMTDFKVGVAVGPNSRLVHTGFNDTFNSYQAQLEGILRSVGPAPATIHCVGHSLGGALANLNAALLHERGYTVCLYTLGAPRVGCYPFASHLETKLRGRIFRVANRFDPVAMVPLFPFCHASVKHDTYITHAGGNLISPDAHSTDPTKPGYAVCMNDPHRKWVDLQHPMQRLGALHQTLDDSIKLIGGGLLFNGQVLVLIGQALFEICNKIAGNSLLMTQRFFDGCAQAADRLAEILHVCATQSVILQEEAKSVIRAIFKFLGRPVTGTTSNLTIALIRWALSQLNSELSAKACLAITRR